MAPAVREKAGRRPPNHRYKPAIWQDEMAEVRETFRRVSGIKPSLFSQRGSASLSGPALSRNRFARIHSQVPSDSLHSLQHLRTNLSQPPFISLTHFQNVLGLSRRIQSQSSLTERKKNPHDAQIYPVFIRRPLADRSPSHHRIPYAYTPPRLTLLSKLHLSKSSSWPSSSCLPKAKQALKSPKPWPASHCSAAPPLSDRCHGHRWPHSAEELSARHPSRCSKPPSSCSSCYSNVSSLSGVGSQSYSNAGSLTPDTSTTSSSISSSSFLHPQGAFVPDRGYISSGDNPQPGRFVIPFENDLSMKARQSAVSSNADCFAPKHRVSFVTPTPRNNTPEQQLPDARDQNPESIKRSVRYTNQEKQESIAQEQQSRVVAERSAEPTRGFKEFHDAFVSN